MFCLLLLRKFEQAVQGGIGNAMALQALQGLAGVVVGVAVALVRVGKYLLVAGRTQLSGEIRGRLQFILVCKHVLCRCLHLEGGHMHTEFFEISSRFCGPPRSGNGGYTCGRVAKHLRGSVTVRLKAPPPLNTELRLESTEQEARLYSDTTLVGEAKLAPLDLQVPTGPSFGVAEEAAQSFVGFKIHAFPGCFVCGPNRAPKDGLRIFPGSIDGSALLAAPWIPHESLADGAGVVQPEFLWSALDCTGAFAVMPEKEGVAIVLGELTVDLTGTVAVGEPCVVVGWSLGTEGRKRSAGSALYAPGGRLVAAARAVWIEVPASTWG